MEKIASFQIDHLRLLRGIYVSRKDKVGDETVTTFDIRMKEPNREDAMSAESSHTIEHIAATYLRNNPKWSEKIIYWGPMGCRTGFYFILHGDMKPEDIVELMKDTFRFTADYEGEIPGAKADECGNWTLHSLSEAKAESRKYLEEVLCGITSANLIYPEK